MRPDERVAICWSAASNDRGAAGGAQSGGSLCAVDPAYPVERLRFMLEDCAREPCCASKDMSLAGRAFNLPVIDLIA